MDKIMEKGISEIVGALRDPIIVSPGGWGDTLPDWIKSAVTLERLAENVKTLKGEEMTGTDAEACAYLYTAGLTAPMGHDWTQIYLYITGKVMSKWNKGTTMPEDILVDSLTKKQEDDLNHLKDWIYKKRVERRLDRDRAERRQKKEEAAAAREAAQPAMF